MQTGFSSSSRKDSRGLLREVVGLALPTWGAFTAHDLMGLVDMFFVGRLGPEAVAAVGMSGVVFGVVIMVGHGLSVGTLTLVSISLGAGRRRRAAEAVGQSLALGMVLSLTVAAGALLFSDRILSALGATRDVVRAGSAYLRIAGAGSWVLIMSMVLGSSLRGSGDARGPFRAMVTANLINAVLDPLMIFGLAGFPRMGVAGSASATVVSRAVGMAMMLARFRGMDGRSLSGRSVGLSLRRRYLRPRGLLMRQIAAVGVFASGRILVQNFSQIALMRIVSGFGTGVVAAFGIGLRLQMMVFAPSMGFGVAAAALVGRYLGACNPVVARRSAWTATACAATVAALVALGAAGWTAALIRLFNADGEVVAAGTIMLRWLCLSFPCVAALFVLGSAMGGGGDTLSPLAAVLVSAVMLRLPGAWWLSRGSWGVTGVWVAVVLSSLAGSVLAALFFERGRWLRVGRRVGLQVRAVG
ncbi:MAG TPA: MATE family efflux transporter [Kiritimatiellae bacterium]|nr:MATE family efflux transporter [Kiritimatiellia bacterium]